jgi:hypothetical protein
VRDTGVGIPAAELPNLFKRFYRIRGAQARGHEGSGIGLVLVQQLVLLHRSTIEVVSTVGQGTTFAISPRTGKGHLTAARIDAARRLASIATLGAAPLLRKRCDGCLPRQEEAEPGTADLSLERDMPVVSSSADAARCGTQGAHILLADDDADMREYLKRLLQQRWRVHAIASGEPLCAVHTFSPELVLAM